MSAHVKAWVRGWYLALRGGKPYERAMADLEAQLQEWTVSPSS